MNYLCETFKSKDIAPPMIKYDKILISSPLNTGLIKISFLSYFIAVFIWKISQRNLDVKVVSHAALICLAEGAAFHKKKMWRRGRASECKSEGVGSCPGGISFEIFNICRRRSTLVKVCWKSSIFMIQLSPGMPESFSDTRLNWSYVTRCGCRTTSSNFFTVYKHHKNNWYIGSFMYPRLIHYVPVLLPNHHIQVHKVFLQNI